MHQIERALFKWADHGGFVLDNLQLTSDVIEFVSLSVSLYCPCMLFSGERDQIERAIKALLPRPQNNFRLFAGGRLVFSEDVEPSLEVKRFLHDEIPGILSAILHSDALLPRLQRLQEFDAEIGSSAGALEAFKQLCAKHSRLTRDSEGAGSESPESDAALVERVLCAPLDENEALLAHKMRQFMISVTARDCSIMVTFWKTSDRGTVAEGPELRRTIVSNREDYTYRIALVDLDSKPISRIPHYASLEESILSAGMKFGDASMKKAGKECFYNHNASS
jgi:hypothetical protein